MAPNIASATSAVRRAAWNPTAKRQGVYFFPPDVKYVERFLSARRVAREAGLGMWAFAAASCDAAYPDVCIPPLPPDLDCGQISATNFTVLASDPHRFDGIGMGLGAGVDVIPRDR